MIELGRHSASCRSTRTATAGAICPAQPSLGWSYVAWQKIWRLAGADHMHVNGLQNKFCETDDSVIASARACLTPMFESKPCTVMPVFSSGQSARQAPRHLCGARVARPDLCRRRRHHGASRTDRRPASPACAKPGKRQWPAFRWPTTRGTTLPCAQALEASAHEAPAARRACCWPSTATTSPGPPPSWRCMTFAGLPTVLFLDAPTPTGWPGSPAIAAIGIAGVARSRSRRTGWTASAAGLPGAGGARKRRSPITRSARRWIPPRMLARSGGRSILGGAHCWDGAWHPLVVAAPGHRGATKRSATCSRWRRTASATGWTGTRHVAPSRHPDGRGRHTAPPEPADRRKIGLVDFVAMKRGESDARWSGNAPMARRSWRST